MSRIPRPARLPLLVVLPVVLLVVVAVALFARGGTTDASTVAREAFGAGDPVRSGVADLRLRVDLGGAQGAQGPISARLRGPFQSRGERTPAFDFDIDATLPGQALRLGALSTGDRGFLKLDGQAFELSPELFRQAQAGRRSGGGQQAPSLRSLGIDPLRWLRDPTVVGSEEQGGVDTDHVRGRVDVARFTGDLDRLLRRTADLRARAGGQQGQQGRQQTPQGLTQEQQQALRSAVRGATLDFWAGEDDQLLRRVLLNVDLDASTIGGQGQGRMSLDLRVSDLNEPQRVQAPQSSTPLAELQERLRGAQGGSGSSGSGGSGSGSAGASGSGSAGASGSGSGGGDAQAEYEQCVQRAGSDVDALRRCLAG